jgi:hypothetical protein
MLVATGGTYLHVPNNLTRDGRIRFSMAHFVSNVPLDGATATISLPGGSNGRDGGSAWYR